MSRMPVPLSPHAAENFAGATATGLSPRVAATLAYAAWWVTGGLFLLLEPDHPYVRFHARQAFRGLGLIWLVGAGMWGVGVLAVFVSVPLFRVAVVGAQLTWAVGVALWLTCLLQAWRGERWGIPGLPAAPADTDTTPASSGPSA